MQVKLNVIVAAAAAVLTSTVMAQDMVVKIGHVGPVSGAQAHYGKDNENGARMAIEDLNAKGVTIGGKKVKLELVAEDDAADPKQGTAAAQKRGRPPELGHHHPGLVGVQPVRHPDGHAVGHQPQAHAAGLQERVPPAGQ